MIGKLILTHGGLARELLAAAQVISGRVSAFEALSLDWSEGFEESRGKVSAALERLDQGEGVLILTDMYGGTPCNIAMTFLLPGKVEVITGVNLPMVLRLACQPAAAANVAEVAHWLQTKAQHSHCVGSDMVQSKKCDNKAAVPTGERT
jgi:PTS system mannose-specific IIA component